MRRLLLCIVLLFLVHNNLFANLTQGHWRWRNNDGDEKTATWKAGQDTAITITDYKAIRLRMEVNNENVGSTKNLTRSLQYATSTGGPWFTVTNNSSTNAFNFGGNNGYVTNNDSTTQQLTDPAYKFLSGNIITSQDPAYTDSIPNNDRREYEWSLKPTANIRQNTTYYFKSSAGADQAVLPSLTATGSTFTANGTPLFANGGFENDLNNWTTATGNGAATFTITTAANYVHTGSKSLAVNVTNHGNANSVTLTSGQLTLSDTGTYLLRFWAIAEKRNAILDVNLQGATTSNTCHYQIYNRFNESANGWQMYQYCFKVTEPVTLQMNFNTNTTYYLDDVEVIDETTNPNIDVKNQYYWQNNFNESYGWLSGDNNNPVVLPDKRIAWIYNDSFIGNNNPHSNVLSTNYIINNLVVVQDGTQLTSVYGGSTGHAQSLFNPHDGNIFWHAGGIVENNQLEILLIEISGGNYAGYSWVGTLSLPDLTVTGLTRLPVTGTTSPNCILHDTDYDYIYFGESSGQFEDHTKVARVPAGQFNSQTPWQFYESDGTWGSSFANGMQLVEGSTAGNVIKLDSANYVMATVPNLSSEIDVFFAKTPVGPWVNQTTIYNIPQEEGILPYEGHLVAQPDSDGMYTFGYSVYPFVTESNGSNGSVAMQIADKTTYVPCYERADLKKLSPFTIRKAADSLLTLTGKDTSNQVLLNWVSAQTTDNRYDVQRSIDNTNWQTLTTVDGSDSTTLAHYQYLDNSAITGVNYYRIVLYDLDDKQNISNTITVNTYQSAYLASFTATRDGQHVKIDWSTSSELNNPQFVVQNSSDNQNWSTLATVAGSGTTTQTSNYETIDTHPFDGMNYYRLQYLFKSRDTLSAVQSVNMLQPLAVKVYPNPAHSQIQFSVQGYTGGNFDVMLCDMSGRIINKSTFQTTTGESYQLNTTAAAGDYVLQVTGTGLKKSTKVIIE